MLAVFREQEDNSIMTDSGSYNNFLKALDQQNFTPLNKVRVVSKRGKRSTDFAEISQVNTAVVDQLIEVAERLADRGNGGDAKEIILIIRTLLDNNHKLQQVVSEALKDIPV